MKIEPTNEKVKIEATEIIEKSNYTFMFSMIKSTFKVNDKPNIFKTTGHELLRRRANKSGGNPAEHTIKK